jgi:hypothetical protein
MVLTVWQGANIMSEYVVTCINKRDRMSSHEHITHIGDSTGASPWRMTRESAIIHIDGKTAAFYTVDRTTGLRVYIGVIRETGKLPYLRTYADGKWNDNLLALAECGDHCTLV